MIDDIENIKPFFPRDVAANTSLESLMLKEFLQTQILEFLSRRPETEHLAFIGGTCLRIVHGIDRFSEDLDFDCKEFTEDGFAALTDAIIEYLRDLGYRAEPRTKENDRITALRRSIYFPELLFDLNLSVYREQKFLIKVEMADQGVSYEPETRFINHCGFVFPLRTAPQEILCAMKVCAVIGRGKGRDFYDLMFLLQRTEPDYHFLIQTIGIENREQLKERLTKTARATDLEMKRRDFEHLLIDRNQSKRILLFEDFIDSL